MKNIIPTTTIDNNICATCWADNLTAKDAVVLVEEITTKPGTADETNRTVYGLCANHAELETFDN